MLPRLLVTTLLLFPALAIAGTLSQDDSRLHDIAKAVSADRIEHDIQTLVNFGTRHTLSETKSDTRGIGAARRWVKSQFEAISEKCGDCLDIY